MDRKGPIRITITSSRGFGANQRSGTGTETGSPPGEANTEGEPEHTIRRRVPTRKSGAAERGDREAVRNRNINAEAKDLNILVKKRPAIRTPARESDVETGAAID